MQPSALMMAVDSRKKNQWHQLWQTKIVFDKVCQTVRMTPHPPPPLYFLVRVLSFFTLAYFLW